jgi:hypothetical protein
LLLLLLQRAHDIHDHAWRRGIFKASTLLRQLLRRVKQQLALQLLAGLAQAGQVACCR